MTIRSLVIVSALLAGTAGCAADPPPASSSPDPSVAVSLTTASASASAPRMAPASTAPMVALLTRAEWCSVCKANGERAGKVLFKGAQDLKFEIMMNDITNDETAAKSLAVLQSKGLADIGQGAAPGTVAFIDSKTRKRVAEVTVAHQDDEIRMAIDIAQKRLSK